MSSMVYVQCPTCRNWRKIRRRDARRVKQCRQCHLSQIAPKGYAATEAKYGKHFAIRFVRDYRLAHPSTLEQIVGNWLDCQRAYYEREYWFEVPDHVYLIDFMLSGSVAVEVNGTWAHQFHAERDQCKLETLRECGFQVIVLSESDVLTGTFALRLAAVLAKGCVA